MRNRVLILGANGRFGRHATEAFWNAGWAIRSFDRAHDDLMQAARDVDVIVAAWNPPYTDWAEQILPLHQRIQEAARVSGATVILPANVYVFAADAKAPWGTETPHEAHTSLGRVRVQMEQSYRDSGVQTILLRAGDFIDTEPTDSWLDKVILKRLHKGRFIYPGHLDADHSWAYLPDLAKAAVALAERRVDLERFEDVPFEGFTLTGRSFARALSEATHLPVTPVEMHWWPLQMARPVWPMAKHLAEMRYLWDTPHRLDGRKLRQLCPEYRDTDLHEALLQMARGSINSGKSGHTGSLPYRAHLRIT